MTASARRQVGLVRVAITLRREPDLHFSVTLNGHAITSQFPPRLGLRRVTVLGADDGLRYGRNLLRVRAATMAGATGTATVTFTIARGAPLIAAGPDVDAIARQHITLVGRAAELAPGGTRPSYRWRIVLAPHGSHAKLSHARRLHALLTPDKLGTYRLRLSVRQNGRTAADELTVTNAAGYPPIGATVDTMASNGAAIQVGSTSHGFNPYPCNALNVMLVDRDTLAVPYAHTATGGPNSANNLLSQITSLISSGQLNSHPYVIVSDTLQNPNVNCTAVNANWNTVLSKIGGRPLSSGVQAQGGWSVVGLYGGPKGSAYENDGSNEPLDILQGEIRGYFQHDYVGAFSFVPDQRIAADLSAPGAPGLQNTIQVGGTSYASGPLSCGTGGFQVVTLNAVTLAQLSSKTVATNGCGTATDTANQQALIGYLQGVAQSPSSSVSKALVLIQSIGSPYDSSTNAMWQQLDAAVAGVGGTQTVLGSDTSSYSLIGSVGISSFPLAEASGTATPKNPAHVTAVLKRVPPYVYEPELSSSGGAFGFNLATLAYQAPQSFADTPGELKALNYISGPKVLGLPVPTAQTAQDFCYIPAGGALDVRYAYCDPDLSGAWLGSQFARDLTNAQWSPGLGFTQTDLNSAIAQLLPSTGHGEFAEVSQVWTAINDLTAATGTSSTTALSIAANEAAKIKTALQNSITANSTGHWIDVIANSLNALGALFPNEAELAEPVNLFAAGLYLAEDSASTGTGAPALGQFSVNATNFQAAMTTAYQNAAAGLTHLLGLIVTDPGKLNAFYDNSASYTYTPTLQSNRAFRLGAAAFAWQSLLPSAFQLDLLPRHTQNVGVTDARNYICAYNAGRRYGPYAPFPHAPLSAQLLNSQLHVLSETGAALPNGQDQNTPPTPPKSLTDPLFMPYQSSNGVITQFGLIKPWFYRRAYPPPLPTATGC